MGVGVGQKAIRRAVSPLSHLEVGGGWSWSKVLSATWRRNVGQVRPSEKSAFVQYCYSESCRIQVTYFLLINICMYLKQGHRYHIKVVLVYQ